MSHPNYDESAALLTDPTTDAATLALIAQHHEGLRAQVAAHPNVYPDLVAWINSLAAPAAPATAPSGSWLATQWSAHRTRSIVAIAAAAALVLGGGGTALALSIPSGSPEPPVAQESKPKPTPTKTTPPPVVKPVGSLNFAIDQSGGLIRDWDSFSIGPNSFLLAGGDYEQTETQLTFTTVAVSEDKPLVATTAYASSGDANYTINSAVYAAQVSSTADAGFAVAMTVTVPVSGATPASTSLQVLPYAAGASSPTRVNSIPWDDSYLQSVSLVGDVAVVAANNDTDYVTGIDTITGEQLWELTGFTPYTETDRLVVGAVGRTWNSMTGGAEGQLVAVDAKTGEVTWTYTAGTFHSFNKDLGAGYAAITAVGSGYYGGNSARIINLNDGSDVVVRSGYYFDRYTSYYNAVNCTYDPSIDSFVLTSSLDPVTGDNWALEVISAADGAVTFSVAGEDYAAIGSPRLIGAGVGRVWVNSTETFVADIFSSATGVQDPLSPALAANEDNGVWAPIMTRGSVSLLENPAGDWRVVVHQNQPLSIALIQAAST